MFEVIDAIKTISFARTSNDEFSNFFICFERELVVEYDS